jgi:hypothetical protein
MMARGQSGRIVIEVDPALKMELYSALARSNSTLKDWFMAAAVQFCESQAQPDLFSAAPARDRVPEVAVEGATHES